MRRALKLTRQVTPGGDRRSVTCSFVYGGEYRSVVARNVTEGWEQARARWGEPDALELVSTPDSIYRDLTGLTAEHARREGVKSRWGQPEYYE